MPLEYELDIVSCPLKLYGESEDQRGVFTVIVQPDSGVELCDRSVARMLREAIETELDDYQQTWDTSVICESSPPHVVVTGEVLDSLSLVKVGNLVAEGIMRAEDVITESDKIENAEIHTGLASKLDMFESQYYEEEY